MRGFSRGRVMDRSVGLGLMRKRNESKVAFKLTCFGVGDGAACGDRNHSSYLYDFGGCSLLLDCGEPISRSFKASGLSCEKIDRILLSHLHFDHIGGLWMLLQGFWLDHRKRELTVHLPREGVEPIRNILRTGYIFDELLEFKMSFIPLEARRSFEVNGVRVTPFRTSHLDGLRGSFQGRYGGEFLAYSFLMEAEGLRVAHSADLGAPEDLEPLLTAPLDLLVCELAHFDVAEICAFLRGKEIGKIAFVHIGRPYWAALEETRKRIAELLPGVEVLFPIDLEELELD